MPKKALKDVRDTASLAALAIVDPEYNRNKQIFEVTIRFFCKFLDNCAISSAMGDFIHECIPFFEDEIEELGYGLEMSVEEIEFITSLGAELFWVPVMQEIKELEEAKRTKRKGRKKR